MIPETLDRPPHLSAPQIVHIPSHEEIAARAFSLYQSRGASSGQDLDDWLQAERELLIERSLAVSVSSFGHEDAWHHERS